MKDANRLAAVPGKLTGDPPSADAVSHSRIASISRREAALFWLGIAIITLLGFFVRFYRLADMPPGFHYDEAFNGLDTYRLLSMPLSRWPLFFSGNFGREPLFNYLMTIAQMITGPSAVTMRFMAALVGALLTPALAWLGWECAPSLGSHRRRVSLWAGLAILTLLWSQVFARYVLRVEFFALLETLFIAALWRGWRTGLVRWFVVAALAGGLAFYTYLPVRLLPAIFFLPSLALLVQRRARSTFEQTARWKVRRTGLVVMCFVGLVIITPLSLYFLQHPADFSQRVSQVSLLQRPTELLHNAGAIAGMFFISGDVNPRNNIPGRPALDWLTVAPFFLGLLFLLRGAYRPAHLLLLSWFGVMLLPTLLSEYAPSFQRAIGALPPVALFIALGLDWVAGGLITKWPQVRLMVTSALTLLLLVGVAVTWQVFRSWSAGPEIFFARDVGFVELAGEVSAANLNYISPRGYDHPTLSFLSKTRESTPELRGFDGRSCVRISSRPGTHYIFLAQEDSRAPSLVRSYLPDTQEQTIVRDPYGRAWATQLTQPSGGRILFPELKPLAAAWHGDLRLRGYWLSMDRLRPGERLFVRLFWQVSQRPEQDLKVFVHLIDALPASGHEALAGFDSEPGRGACATTTWEPDETIVDELELVLPQSLPSETYLEIGLYDAVSQVRLPRADATGDVELIGPFIRATP